jgi:glycogen phosphorylase
VEEVQIMDVVIRLRALARNLYWTWHPEVVELFRDIEPELWREVNHNPVEFLARISESVLRAKAEELTMEARVSQAYHRMESYLRGEETWGSYYAGPLQARPVAYFSAEFGLHESLPTYAGGLGVLAGDHLKSASDLGVPIVGIGLFYAKGYFTQRLDLAGWQKEEYLASDLGKLPLDRVVDQHGRPVQVQVETSQGQIHVGIWNAWVGRNRLLLLDTNVEGNNDEWRALTGQLYGGDSTVRIRQELVLGVGGLRALAALGIKPGVIHLNEGHSAFALLENVRAMMEREGRSFQQVMERSAMMSVFTTHTPVEAGHDWFEPWLVEQTLGGLRRQLRISERELFSLGRKETGGRDMFCMTILGLKMSRFRNAVSAIHGRVSRAMWTGVWPGMTEEEVPITHVTNGVHVASWLAAPMARVYQQHLGDSWRLRPDDPQTWAKIQNMDDVEFWEQHQILKDVLVEYVRRCLLHQEDARGGRGDQLLQALNPSVLTIGFARRFAVYKRADLLFNDVNRLDRLINHPETPIQIIYSGKAHPADEPGKRLVQKIFQATRDPRFAGKIVFLENHDINVSRHMVQGVDLWVNNPYRPMEACGTSGQKVILNGGLNLSILDGWWAEAYDGTNGFAIGDETEHSNWAEQDHIDAKALYEALERQVVPLFYARDADGIPHGWVERQKRAIRTLAWRFSGHRMLKDYTLGSYLPAVGGVTSSYLSMPWGSCSLGS